MRPLLALFALAPLAGCSDYQFAPEKGHEDGLSEEARPEIAVTPGLIDFGVLPDARELSRTVTIENLGNAELRLDPLRIDGPDVFATTAPELTVLGPGARVTATVTYAPTEDNAEHTGQLFVESNDPERPRVVVELIAAIEQQSIDTGDPVDEVVDTCACRDGFEANADDTACIREVESPATAVGEPVEVCSIVPYFAYGYAGALYPGGTVVRDTYWGQDDGVPNGRLNAVGVWGCTAPGSGVAGSEPVHSWIGFSVCVDAPADGDYLVGLGGDNRVRFAVDGAQVMEQTDDVTRNFNYWFLHAVPLAAGTHILDIEGYNAGSIAAFGAEVAGPFASGSLVDDPAMQAADYAGSILWSTADAIGNAFPIGEGVNWECPDGAVLEGCEQPVCISIEEEPCLTGG